jgi:hypothetical protein
MGRKIDFLPIRWPAHLAHLTHLRAKISVHMAFIAYAITRALGCNATVTRLSILQLKEGVLILLQK